VPGSSRPTFEPVDPKKQREALQFIGQGLLSAKSFQFEPQFLARVRPDHLGGDTSGPVSISTAVLGLQTALLDQVMSPMTAQRLLELPAYTERDQRAQLLTLSELHASLRENIWNELRTGSDIELMRRNLQREHLKRIQVLLTQSSAPVPTDAISLVRAQATALQADLSRALAKNQARARSSALSVEARAHLEWSLAQLQGALKAGMVKN